MTLTQTQPRTLEDWNKRFGGDEGMDPFANDRGRQGFDYQEGMAYFCRIKKATLVRDKRGDEQIRLLVAPLAHEGEDAGELGESLEHITLPWQESDKSMPRDTRERILRLRVDTLKRIYSAAIPSLYAPYDKTDADPATNKKRYLDFDGTPLTNGKYEARAADINERTMQTLEMLKERLAGPGGEIDELAEARVFIHKKHNNKNPQYPYTNWYANRPQKLPVYEAGGNEAPF